MSEPFFGFRSPNLAWQAPNQQTFPAPTRSGTAEELARIFTDFGRDVLATFTDEQEKATPVFLQRQPAAQQFPANAGEAKGQGGTGNVLAIVVVALLVFLFLR